MDYVLLELHEIAFTKSSHAHDTLVTPLSLRINHGNGIAICCLYIQKYVLWESEVTQNYGNQIGEKKATKSQWVALNMSSKCFCGSGH